MKGWGPVAVVALATAVLGAVLLFPVMGDSRGSLSVLGTPVPSDNGLVAVAAAIAAAVSVGGLMSALGRKRGRQ